MIARPAPRVKDVDDIGRLARARNDWSNFTRGVDYLWYLSKNFFKIQCPQRSLFNQASEPNIVLVELIPDGYARNCFKNPERTSGEG